MKCLACDTTLTDYEATLRDVNTFEYVSECLECLRSSNGVFDLTERSYDATGVDKQARQYSNL